MNMDRDEITKFIKEIHQEAHKCYALKEVHNWIDYIEKELRKKDRTQHIGDIDQDLKIIKANLTQ